MAGRMSRSAPIFAPRRATRLAAQRLGEGGWAVDRTVNQRSQGAPAQLLCLYFVCSGANSACWTPVTAAAVARSMTNGNADFTPRLDCSSRADGAPCRRSGLRTVQQLQGSRALQLGREGVECRRVAQTALRRGRPEADRGGRVAGQRRLGGMRQAAARRERSEFIVFCYSDIPEILVKRAGSTPNLQVVNGREAILGGVRAEWEPPDDPLPDLWANDQFALRDFRNLAAYLARSATREFEKDTTIQSLIESNLAKPETEEGEKEDA